MSAAQCLRQAAQRQAEGDLAGAWAALQPLRVAAPDWPALPGLASTVAEVAQALHHTDDAVAWLSQALAQQPRNVELLCALGQLHSQRGEAQQAVACLGRAVPLAPNDAAVHNNLGNALQAAGRAADAAQAFRRALALRPGAPVVLGNLAGTLLALGRVDDALSVYVQRLSAQPRNAAAYSDLLLAMNYSAAIGPEQLATAHRRYGEQIGAALQAAPLPHTARTARLQPRPLPLRVGLLSSDLRQHSVAHFVSPLLDHLDPGRVQVVAYANHASPDAVSARLQARCAAWRPIAHLDDDAVAALVRSDAIDLLVDLNGHTGGNRLPVLARRPAPVQLTWLGYPHSTGLAAVDHRLTDAVADPPGDADRWHTEALWRLPGCFVCYEPPADAPPPATRQPAAPGQVTFGSLNNPAKLSPPVVALWAQLLGRLPASRLVLKLRGEDDPSIRHALLARFAAQGVDPARIDVLGRLPGNTDHLRRYHAIDIALDTFPYAGTTTTCDALWMGVPVVTLAGERHASRVGASLLAAVGLPDLVADSAERYLAIAGELAQDLPRLQALRQGLRTRMAASPLTDGAGFARRFEAALHAIWQQHAGGR